MQNIRLLPPQKNGNRLGRHTWTDAECSRIFGGEIVFVRTNFTDGISTKVFSLSARTGACHAPVFAGRGEESDYRFRQGASVLESPFEELTLLDEVKFCHPIFPRGSLVLGRPMPRTGPGTG